MNVRRVRPAYELVYKLLGDDAALHDAFDLADFAHNGQTRSTPTGRVPYLLHPLRVFFRLLSWGVTDRVVLIAALLHDVVEDAPELVLASFLARGRYGTGREGALAAIADRFGTDVADVVRGLTNSEDVPYLDHVSDATADPRVLAVKLSDFTDNALTVGPDHPRREKLRAKYAPLFPILRTRLALSREAQALIPRWRQVHESLVEPAWLAASYITVDTDRPRSTRDRQPQPRRPRCP